MIRYECKVLDDVVAIENRYDNGDTVTQYITFAELCAAARALREHVASITPVDVEGPLRALDAHKDREASKDAIREALK